MSSYRSDHIRLLAFHLGLAFVIGAAGFAGVLTSGTVPGLRRSEEMFVIAPLLSGFCAIMGLACVGLAALIISAELRIRVGRNLAQATARMAAHHSVLLVIWTACVVGQSAVFLRLIRNGEFRAWVNNSVMFRGIMGMADIELFCLLLLAALNVPIAVWYYLVIHRAAWAARFANR